jgi:competence protein ComEC
MDAQALLVDRPRRSVALDAALALFIVALTTSQALLAPPKPWPRAEDGLASRWRAVIQERLDLALDPPTAPWASGLLLGDDSGFSSKWKEVFRRTGTTHLTAVSGYNVAIVFSAVQLLLARAPFSRLPRALLGLATVVLFILLTGHPASVVRAGIMAFAVEAARFAGRPVKPLRALLLAGAVMTLLDPSLPLRDRGFQLSFLAVFGLAALAPPLRSTLFRRWPREAGKWAGETVAATVMTAPLIAWMTGRYSLVAFACNLLLSVLMPVLMAAAAVIVGLALVSPPLAALLAPFAAALLGVPLAMLRTASSLPGAALDGPAAFVALVAIQSACLLLLVRWWRREGGRRLLYVQAER